MREKIGSTAPRRRGKTIAYILGIGAAMALATMALGATSKTLPNGDQVQFDGTYYDFRDAAGKQMIKMWVPPTAKPVRGVFICGHGGGGGDSRDFARDENMKAMAARYGFGLAGLHNFPGGAIYPRQAGQGGPAGAPGAPTRPQPAQPATPGGKVFFDALSSFASLGVHPELANIPFVFMGSSNGGSQAYALASYAPERAVCFVSNVSAPRSILNEAALTVPGIFFVGRYDLLSREGAAVRAGYATVLAARAKGASETRVLFKHALRNALIPVVTILGMDVAGMLGGVLFVENVFALPGFGTLAVQSVFNLDPPMIMGTVLFSAALVVGANWVVDLMYGWIDPRIKSGT